MYMYTSVYIYMHTHIYVYTYLYIYTYICIYIRIYTYMYIYTYIYKYMYIYIYTYTYVWIHIHIHIHTYIHMLPTHGIIGRWQILCILLCVFVLVCVYVHICVYIRTETRKYICLQVNVTYLGNEKLPVKLTWELKYVVRRAPDYIWNMIYWKRIHGRRRCWIAQLRWQIASLSGTNKPQSKSR